MAHVPRIYVPGMSGHGQVQLDGDQAKRLGAVMRVKPGDSVLLFPGDGREWSAVVAAVGRGRVVLDVHEIIRQEARPAVHVDVCLGVVRPNRMDLAIEKCTEAGASLFRPLVCEFSQRHAEGPTRLERWERIAIEAAEQSGRLFVPVVLEPESFDHWLAMPGKSIVFGERNGMGPAEAASLLPQAGTVAVAIGPEGGFSPQEAEALRGAGGLGMSFGGNILRAETAAIAGTLFIRSMRP